MIGGWLTAWLWSWLPQRGCSDELTEFNEARDEARRELSRLKSEHATIREETRRLALRLAAEARRR